MTLQNKCGVCKKVWGWSPLILTLLIFMIFPFNPTLYAFLLNEDSVVEWGTVLFALGGFYFAGKLAYLNYRKEQITIHTILLLLYALGCFFFAGEEISWGQRLLGFETQEISPTLNQINKQNEFNLHNIPIFSKVRLVADLFCIVWGILVPLVYANRPFFIAALQRYIAPMWLIPAFGSALLVTMPLKLTEWFYGRVEWVVDIRVGELKEMMLGMIFLFYAYHLYSNFVLLMSESCPSNEPPVQKTG